MVCQAPLFSETMISTLGFGPNVVFKLALILHENMEVKTSPTRLIDLLCHKMDLWTQEL
jgi:hypothetical protein